MTKKHQRQINKNQQGRRAGCCQALREELVRVAQNKMPIKLTAVFLTLDLTRMETHALVSAMTDAYAQKAGTIAREFNGQPGLQLELADGTGRHSGPACARPPPGGPSSGDLTGICEMWGLLFWRSRAAALWR